MKLKAWWPAVGAIAINTYRETIRDRVLYSLIAFSVLVIAATLLAASISLGQDTRVVQDFGLTAVLVFLMFITIFIGTQLVYREVERKTVYLLLTKPVSREQFYIGKFLGLCLTIAFAGAVMGVEYLALVKFKTGAFSAPGLIAIVMILLEAWLLTAVGMLFSAFTSPLSSAVYTFGLLLIGHASATIWTMAQKASAIVRYLLEMVYYLFPNLEKFNLRNEAVFNLHPSAEQIGLTLLYFVGYLTAVLLLGIAAFRRHEF